MARFRTMRDYDARLKRYLTDLCGIIPDATDLTGLTDRLDELESEIDDLGAELDECCPDEPASDTTINWDMGLVTGTVDTVLDMGDAGPVNAVYDLSA